MLQFKPEVRVTLLTEQLADVLRLATIWSLRTRVGVEVNSIDDQAPGRVHGTLHGYSLAVDLDTVGDKPQETEELADFLARTLDPQWDVLWETNHVHAEWDARRRPLKAIPSP